jgi:hypothetical protein
MGVEFKCGGCCVRLQINAEAQRAQRNAEILVFFQLIRSSTFSDYFYGSLRSFANFASLRFSVHL